MTIDSTPTGASHVNGDSVLADHSSMLLPFIYDTSSFSDLQVQIANGGATSASTHEALPAASGGPEADTNIHNEKKKNDKLVHK